MSHETYIKLTTEIDKVRAALAASIKREQELEGELFRTQCSNLKERERRVRDIRRCRAITADPWDANKIRLEFPECFEPEGK